MVLLCHSTEVTLLWQWCCSAMTMAVNMRGNSNRCLMRMMAVAVLQQPFLEKPLLAVPCCQKWQMASSKQQLEHCCNNPEGKVVERAMLCHGNAVHDVVMTFTTTWLQQVLEWWCKESAVQFSMLDASNNKQVGQSTDVCAEGKWWQWASLYCPMAAWQSLWSQQHHATQRKVAAAMASFYHDSGSWEQLLLLILGEGVLLKMAAMTSLYCGREQSTSSDSNIS